MNKTKVAAYARVSTDMTDQLHSLSAQIKYFTEYISQHEGWELVEVYYDEGITGTSVKKRDDFNRMIADSEIGKIDLILTKEVSRFARNTVDTLNYTRRLSELHIGVIFMNDGIDTREKDGKLRLTIMSSIAQEESRKISERVKWSMKRNMENGVVLGCGRIYRYKIKEGKLEVVPEEAEIVKQIFSWYLYDGMGSHSIARNLDEQGIPTLKNHVWSPQHVLKILKNDKYAGDLTQWKVYKPNVLSEKVLVNHGDNSDAPLITIHNHHEPLISKEMWDEVQNELYRRSFLSREGRKHSKSYWFSGKMRCGKCDYSYIVASSTSNPFRSLGCRNRQIHGKQRRMGLNGEWFGCDNHMVDERILDKVMEHIMNEMKLMLPVLETEIVQDLQMLQAPESEADVTGIKQEIEKLEQKKRKAIDLMLEELITKEDLKKQTTYYDSEIVRLTEQMTKMQNTAEIQQRKGAEVQKMLDYFRALTASDSNPHELYRSIVKQIIVPEYPRLNVYLSGVPFWFDVVYTAKKAPRFGIYEIVIEKCEVVSL